MPKSNLSSSNIKKVFHFLKYDSVKISACDGVLQLLAQDTNGYAAKPVITF